MNSPNGSDLSQAIDMEKTMATDEQVETCKSLETIDAEIHGVDAAERRKILWKIDRRLISSLGLMVAISLLDRTNLGNAMIAGMSAELHMSVGDRYVSEVPAYGTNANVISQLRCSCSSFLMCCWNSQVLSWSKNWGRANSYHALSLPGAS